MNPSINPLFPVNPQGLDDIARSLLEATPPSPPQGNAPPKKDFIYVPSIRLYVAKERSHFDKSWNDTWQELKAENKQMLTIPQFWEFTEYLQNGYQHRDEARQILDDIFKTGNWRGEWLDAYFEQRKSGILSKKEWYMLTDNKSKEEKLSPFLLKDSYADISSKNPQGLLTTASSNQSYLQGNNVYFYHPRNGSVARFFAGSVLADLNCGRIPSFSNPSLGVREAQPSGNATKK